MAAFLGMRGTGDWATNQVPESWRAMILLLFPNGSAPLTGILSKMPSESIDSFKHHWWTKDLPRQGGTTASIYIDFPLVTTYVYDTHQATQGIAGATVYAKVAEAVADEFRIGHTAVLRDASDMTVDVVAEVTNVTKNGASSVIACKLVEADDNAGTPSNTASLQTVDTILVTGSAHAEGASTPEAIGYDPSEFDNLTQIFRTSLELTGTALQTALRTGDALKEQQREALLLHGIEMEKAIIRGVKRAGTGTNGKPLRTLDGITSFIKAATISNNFNFTTDSDFTGQTWLAGGEEFLDLKLAEIFRFGNDEKLGFCGYKVLTAINKLAKAGGQINLQPRTVSYGLKVHEWITPHGTLFLKTHPLFSHETTEQERILIVEPQNLRFRPIRNRDTMYIKDNRDTSIGIDGKVEEYRTEGTLELHHPETMGIIDQVGQDA